MFFLMDISYSRSAMSIITSRASVSKREYASAFSNSRTRLRRDAFSSLYSSLLRLAMSSYSSSDGKDKVFSPYFDCHDDNNVGLHRPYFFAHLRLLMPDE